MIKNNYKIIFSAILLLLIVIALMGWAILNTGRTALLEILVAPAETKTTLNGKNVKSGKLKVKPGKYTISADKAGFISDKLSVDIAANESKFLGIALNPNTNETKDWYKNHPEDQLLRESITGRNFDQNSTDLVSQNPILKKLPFLGAGLEFRIDAGVSQKGSDQPAIYIRYKTDEAKNDALQWIKNSGFNPDTMELILLFDAPTTLPAPNTSSPIPD